MLQDADILARVPTMRTQRRGCTRHRLAISLRFSYRTLGLINVGLLAFGRVSPTGPTGGTRLVGEMTGVTTGMDPSGEEETVPYRAYLCGVLLLTREFGGA